MGLRYSDRGCPFTIILRQIHPVFFSGAAAAAAAAAASPSSVILGDLDIPSMRVAAARLIGFHDFRNFCKIDRSEVGRVALYGSELFVSPFFKCIQSAEIVEKPTRSGLTVHKFTLLCHQRIQRINESMSSLSHRTFFPRSYQAVRVAPIRQRISATSNSFYRVLFAFGRSTCGISGHRRPTS